ncbi:hypothetical protein [Paraburkholderia youngii]|uniref:hypothetical protein n=1 Tax=Paraburkholderia youngii TaxID=2782701 RepID=UPI003D191197
MKNRIPSKFAVELTRSIKLSLGPGVFAFACYVLLQVHQIDHPVNDVLGRVYWIGFNLSALVAAWSLLRCALLCLWPAKFAEFSSAWDVIAADALEKHFPGSRVTLFGREKWLVTDIASGKTKTQVRGSDALHALVKESAAESSSRERPGTEPKISHLSQYRK